MSKQQKRDQGSERDKLLGDAIGLLKLGNFQEREEVGRHIKWLAKAYCWPDFESDRSFINDQLVRLESHLSQSVGILESIHPLIRFELFQFREISAESLSSNDPESEIDPDIVRSVARECFPALLGALRTECSHAAKRHPLKVGAPSQPGKKWLVYFALELFAEKRPGEARPHSGDFYPFASAIYTYVTGDETDQLLRPITEAFKKLRNERPELLPKHLQTPRSRKLKR